MEYNRLINIGAHCIYLLLQVTRVTLKRRRRHLKVYIITIALLYPKCDFSHRKKQNRILVSLNCDVYVRIKLETPTNGRETNNNCKRMVILHFVSHMRVPYSSNYYKIVHSFSENFNFINSISRVHKLYVYPRKCMNT